MKYDYINSMRGIAILMVMLVHTSQSAYGLEGYALTVASFCQMGVQLFFVVSAFTLCMSFEKRSTEARPVASFFIRRAFRVAPAYIIIGVFGYMLLRTVIQYIEVNELSIPPKYSLYNVLSNLFFVHGVYPLGIRLVPGGWSIGVEMLFYLLFPASFLFLRKRLTSVGRIVVFPLAVATFSFVAINYLLGYTIRNNDFVYFSLLNQLSVFAVGISLYFIYNRNSHFFYKISVFWVFCLFVLASFSTAYMGWNSDVSSRFSLLPFLAAVSFIPLVELFKRKCFLNHKLLMSIGERSYSMYLIHFVFAHQLSGILNSFLLLDAVGPIVSLIVTFAMTVFLTFHLSKISYLYVERYFIGVGKLLINKI